MTSTFAELVRIHDSSLGGEDLQLAVRLSTEGRAQCFCPGNFCFFDGKSSRAVCWAGATEKRLGSNTKGCTMGTSALGRP